MVLVTNDIDIYTIIVKTTIPVVARSDYRVTELYPGLLIPLLTSFFFLLLILIIRTCILVLIASVAMMLLEFCHSVLE